MKLALQHGEISGKARAHIRQRAARIDEIDGHYFAAQIGGTDGAAILVGELEIGKLGADGDFLFGRGDFGIGRAAEANVARYGFRFCRPKIEQNACAGMEGGQFLRLSARNGISIAGI